jgi:hypothetical protein
MSRWTPRSSFRRIWSELFAGRRRASTIRKNQERAKSLLFRPEVAQLERRDYPGQVMGYGMLGADLIFGEHNRRQFDDEPAQQFVTPRLRDTQGYQQDVGGGFPVSAPDAGGGSSSASSQPKAEETPQPQSGFEGNPVVDPVPDVFADHSQRMNGGGGGGLDGLLEHHADGGSGGGAAPSGGGVKGGAETGGGKFSPTQPSGSGGGTQNSPHGAPIKPLDGGNGGGGGPYISRVHPAEMFAALAA